MIMSHSLGGKCGSRIRPFRASAVWLVLVVIASVSCSGRDAVSTESVTGIPDWPPVSIPKDEFFIRLGDCLTEKGYVVEVNAEEGSIGFPGQQEGSQEASRACMAEIDPTYLDETPPFSEVQLNSLYDYVSDQVDCFVELGYPRVDLPSYERFANELRGRFDPVGVLAGIGELPTDDQIKTCRSRAKPSWFNG